MTSDTRLGSLRLRVSARDQKGWKPDGGGGEAVRTLYDHIKRRGVLVEERRSAKGDGREALVGIPGIPIKCICRLRPDGTSKNGAGKGDLTLTVDAPPGKFTGPESDRLSK